MSFQSSVSQYPSAFGPAGSRFGAGHAPERAMHNKQDPVPGVWNVAYTFSGGATHTLTINGIPIATPSNTDDATTAVDALADAQAVTFLAGIASFAAGAAGSIVVTELEPGAITSIVGAATAGATTVTNPTPSVLADPLEGGIIVHGDSALGQVARLPRAAPTGTVYLAGVVAHRHRGIDRRLPAAEQALYPPGNQVPVGHRGGYILVCETAIDEAGQLFYRITPSGANTQRGAIRNDNDGGNAIALSNARALRSVTAAGVVPVALNLV